MISTEQAVSFRRGMKAIVAEWNRSAKPDAEELLARHPELRRDRAFVVDAAYHDYCARCEAGEKPDIEEFCDRFPSCRTTLRRCIASHQLAARDFPFISEPPPWTWPLPGDRVGDLTLLRELGFGTFSRVYLALEESTGGRPVVVKFSPGTDAEARTLGRLSHPNIVPILSARFHEPIGMTAVCMPFLGAATLEDVRDCAYSTADAAPPTDAAVIREAIRSTACSDDPPLLACGPLRPLADGSYADAVARIAIQVADALAFLHAEGVVHQDLKPPNVLLRPDGQALLLDFNVSADDRGFGPRLGGTLPYMAPEQHRALIGAGSSTAVDGRADLFSLGVMLYELLTGKHPFERPPAGLPPELAAAQLQGLAKKCVPVRTFNPAVDRELARLVEQCLAFDPKERPVSAADLAVRLRRHLAPPARLRRWAARRPWIASAAAALVLLAAGGATTQLAAPQPSNDARDYNRGRAAYLDGDYAHAEEFFNQAVQDCAKDLKPRSYYLARAAAAIRLGEADDNNALFSTAIVDLQEALRRQSDGATLALMGYCNSRAGNHANAVLWYDKALAAGYTSAGLYNDRGWSRSQIEPGTAAQEDFDLAVKTDANLQTAFYNRALNALKQNPGAASQAVLGDMQRAADVGPGSQELYLTAARLFVAAAKEGNSADVHANAVHALSYLQRAAGCGVDPKSIVEKSPAFSEVLNPLPGFHDLLAATAGPDGPIATPHLVDPAPYLPE